MKQFLFILFALATISAQSQTYCYINAIEVTPNPSTTEDEISLHVFGDFSNTASHIVSHTITVSGNDVFLDINCDSGFGASVLVPFDTVFTVGMLSAGDYVIELGGDFLGDFIEDPSDYEFTVNTVDGLSDRRAPSFSLSLYQRQLSIIRPSDVAPSDVVIVDVKGVVVLRRSNVQGGKTNLDMSALPNGTYVVTLNGVGKTIVIR